jgi:guanylate kinase
MSEEEFEKMVARMALIEWKHINDATPVNNRASSY